MNVRGAARWLAPSLVVGVCALIAAALVEGAVHASRVAIVITGAGEAMVRALPVLVVGISIVRGLAASWRPHVAKLAPAMALAAFAYGLVAIALVFTLGTLGAAFGAASSRLAWVVAAVAGGAAVVGAVLAVACAPFALRAGGAVVARVWPSVTRRAIAIVMAGVALAALVALWVVARRGLKIYQLGIAPFAIGAIAGAVVAMVVVRRWRERALALGAGALIAAALAWSSARLVADATVLLDAWYQLPVGGRMIQRNHSIAELRGEALAIPVLVPRAAQHPDIVVVGIDALRADRVTRALMPNLAALRETGASFSRAYAPSTVTRGSIPSMVTMLSPGRIRGRLMGFALKLDPRHVLLAEQLQRAGYATAGFLCCAQHFGGPFEIGLDRGLEQTMFDRAGDHLVQAAISFLADPARDGRPRFAWMHMYEAHGAPQAYPPAIFGEDYPPRYDRAVADLDRILAPLWAAIAARGRPTIVIVTADHGEGLNQHGVRFHAGRPYVEQLHVPLIVVGVGGALAGQPRTIATTVSLTSLGATVIDLAGFVPPAADGESLVPLIAGTAPAGDGEAYSLVQRDRSIGFVARSLVAGDYHLVEVEGAPPLLFSLAADPGELDDLAAREPARLAELQRRLAIHRARDARPPF